LSRPEEAELAHPVEDRVGERRLLPLLGVRRELLLGEGPDRLAQLLVLVGEDEVLAPRAVVRLEDLLGARLRIDGAETGLIDMVSSLRCVGTPGVPASEDWG
jgi:hypothetical protein